LERAMARKNKGGRSVHWQEKQRKRTSERVSISFAWRF
jgi:hypothetical protein